ncbi:MAG: manganese efflux pump [Oscillospiraceae bacterium]
MLEIILTDVLLGASLSVDAFAVTVSEGLACPQSRLKNTLLQALYFGFFQFLMPLIGFYLAGTVSGSLMALGPYISFFMLAFVGGKMLFDTYSKKDKGEKQVGGSCKFNHGKTLLLAIATSIDALAVGVSLAFTAESIWLPGAIIGVTTFVICLVGGLLCLKLPKGSGKLAGTAGGVVLVGIGVKILLEGILK